MVGVAFLVLLIAQPIVDVRQPVAIRVVNESNFPVAKPTVRVRVGSIADGLITLDEIGPREQGVATFSGAEMMVMSFEATVGPTTVRWATPDAINRFEEMVFTVRPGGLLEVRKAYRYWWW